MSLGLILIITLVVFLLDGFGGRLGDYDMARDTAASASSALS